MGSISWGYVGVRRLSNFLLFRTKLCDILVTYRFQYVLDSGSLHVQLCIHSGIVELEGLLLMVPALTSVKNGEHIVSCVLFKRNYVNCRSAG